MDVYNQCTGLRPSNDGRYFRCFNSVAFASAAAPDGTQSRRCTACLAFRQPASAVDGGPVHRCGAPKKTGDGGPCRSAVEKLGMLCVHHHEALQAQAQSQLAKTSASALGCCRGGAQTTIHRFFKPIPQKIR
jgi:hypothetical protein